MDGFFSNLRIRGKFYIILTTQVVLLLCVAFIGWTIQRTLGLTERNASATVELTATISETANTVEDLARLSSELRVLASHFRVH